MSLEFTDKAEVLLFLEKLKLFYSFQNELLSLYLSIFFIKTAFQSINNSIFSTPILSILNLIEKINIL